MLRRRRKDIEVDRARGKDGGRLRNARRRQAEKPAAESTTAKPVEREGIRTKARARRKARFLKAVIVQDRAARSGRTRRTRRPSALRALPRKVRALLRDLG